MQGTMLFSIIAIIALDRISLLPGTLNKGKSDMSYSIFPDVKRGKRYYFHFD